VLIAKIASARRGGEQAAEFAGDLIAGVDGEGVLGIHKAVTPLAVHGDPVKDR